VKWDRNVDAAGTGGLITGYVLARDDGMGGLFTNILDTRGTSPQISEHLITGLTSSLLYRFKVTAYNYNNLAAGESSDSSSYYACEAPKTWVKPSKLSTTTETISVGWNEPSDNGGCSIKGYSVHVDDA